MHPDHLLWLLWLALSAFAVIYLGTLLLLARATRRTQRHTRPVRAVQHGHLTVLRPVPTSPEASSPSHLPSPTERRRRGG